MRASVVRVQAITELRTSHEKLESLIYEAAVYLLPWSMELGEEDKFWRERVSRLKAFKIVTLTLVFYDVYYRSEQACYAFISSLLITEFYPIPKMALMAKTYFYGQLFNRERNAE